MSTKRRPPSRSGKGTRPPIQATVQRHAPPGSRAADRSRPSASRRATARRRRRTMGAGGVGAAILAVVIALAVVDHSSGAGYETAANA